MIVFEISTLNVQFWFRTKLRTDRDTVENISKTQSFRVEFLMGLILNCLKSHVYYITIFNFIIQNHFVRKYVVTEAGIYVSLSILLVYDILIYDYSEEGYWVHIEFSYNT